MEISIIEHTTDSVRKQVGFGEEIMRESIRAGSEWYYSFKAHCLLIEKVSSNCRHQHTTGSRVLNCINWLRLEEGKQIGKDPLNRTRAYVTKIYVFGVFRSIPGM